MRIQISGQTRQEEDRWGEKKGGRDTFVLLDLIEARAISFESFESSKMARVTQPRKQRHRRSRETFRIATFFHDFLDDRTGLRKFLPVG